MGDKKNFDFLKKIQDDGTPVPILDNQPHLFEDLKPYWHAFGILKTSRNTGGMAGVGFIPYSEITNYLDEAKIKIPYEREEYTKWIQYIDREDVRLSMEKNKNKPKKKPPPPKRKK